MAIDVACASEQARKEGSDLHEHATRAGLDRPGGWTFEDLVELPDDGRRWEVVDGVAIPMTPPTVLHEQISLRLFRQLDRHCPEELEALPEPGSRLGRDGRVPDVAVVRSDRVIRRGQVGTDAADAVLLAEVVSSSTRKDDCFLSRSTTRWRASRTTGGSRWSPSCSS